MREIVTAITAIPFGPLLLASCAIDANPTLNALGIGMVVWMAGHVG